MTEDVKNPNWIEMVVKWASGQPFNNVLLLMCLAGGGWVVVKLVPLHIAEIQHGIAEIQHGYERIELSHREERQRDEEQHTKQTTVLMQTLEKMIDRGDHRPAKAGSIVADPADK